MEIINYYFALFITFAAIPALHTLSNEECARRTTLCLRTFMELPSERRDLCRRGNDALVCVRRLDCDSVMYIRQAFRQVSQRLHDSGEMTCDLGNFLQDFPVDCADEGALRRCVVTYTDRILSHTATQSRNKNLICQDLSDYAECQLKWDGEDCNVTETTLRLFAEEEKSRLALTDCEIPSLDASSAVTASLLAVMLAAIFSTLMSARTV